MGKIRQNHESTDFMMVLSTSDDDMFADSVTHPVCTLWPKLDGEAVSAPVKGSSDSSSDDMQPAITEGIVSTPPAATEIDAVVSPCLEIVPYVRCLELITKFTSTSTAPETADVEILKEEDVCPALSSEEQVNNLLPSTCESAITSGNPEDPVLATASNSNLATCKNVEKSPPKRVCKETSANKENRHPCPLGRGCQFPSDGTAHFSERTRLPGDRCLHVKMNRMNIPESNIDMLNINSEIEALPKHGCPDAEARMMSVEVIVPVSSKISAVDNHEPACSRRLSDWV